MFGNPSGGVSYFITTEHSRGVLTLVKAGFDCQWKVCKQDELGRYVILKSTVQGQPFIFVNIYAPNKVNEQCVSVYDEIHNELAKVETIE